MNPAPVLTSILEFPIRGTDAEWDHYRLLVLRQYERSEISTETFKRLRLESWERQLADDPPAPRRSPRRFEPTIENFVELRGPRIREASVLIIRSRPRSDLAKIMWLLNRRGFVVAGKRPREVLRKALEQEIRGVVGRVPTLRVDDAGRYEFIDGSLTGRTRRRWEFLFPTLALHRLR
jgi:hypothetical protein